MTNISLFGLLIIAAAISMLVVAVWIYYRSNNVSFLERVNLHFNRVLRRSTKVSGIPSEVRETYWHRLRTRASIYAGFELQDWHFAAIPLLFVTVGLLGWLVFNWTVGLLLFGTAVLVFGFILPYRRLQRKRALIISQVPMFIDQVLRSLSTGRSLESAIKLAVAEALDPLQYILERVVRETELGAGMAESFSQTAKLHGLQELSLIALAIRISNIYGSSPNEMLERVVNMIRQQELARRELAAMTGETRISAWVLGLTPVALAAYLMLVNPSYINLMLQEDSGKTILTIAFCLQGIGGFILWRMLKSV